VRTRADALRSMKRYVALALGDPWEVRLYDEPGTFDRPFALVAKVGAGLYDGPAHTADIVQPMTVHCYPDETQFRTVEDAILGAEEVEKLLYEAFRVGISYDDPLMPPPSFVCVDFDHGGQLPAGTYRYRVSTVNASGESVATVAVEETTTGDLSRMELAWSPAPGATSYRVYRAVGAGASKLLAEVEYPATSYTDLGTLAPGTQDPPTVGTGTARISSGPERVPLYDYDGRPYSGEHASSSVREATDHLRIVTLSLNTLHDATDERLVWVAADIRTSWRRRGRVHSGSKVLKSVTTKVLGS
jgi:hypothetical protein